MSNEKTISTGMWTVLETILFGILLLYAAVSISTQDLLVQSFNYNVIF